MLAEVPDHAGALARACDALARGDMVTARTVIQSDYAFVAHGNAGRAYTELQSMRIFLRDRFTDRYSGLRLVFPATLRLLSRLLPEELPAHPNWKMDQSHIAYWELFPTVDHVVPVARGGRDDESDWVTTSMLRNSAKSHWTVEELGWTLRAPNAEPGWDGLVIFCREYLVAHPEHLADKYIARWHRAALKASES
jgi:hypothetical protein